jgi:hypothetical protein
MDAPDESLADRLLRMADADRAMRTKAIDGEAEWDDSVDEANQSELMEIVRRKGWPTISKVGNEASQAAWLLVQHAPSLEFMESCLALMEDLPQGEINPANLAYLRDRVLVRNGEPQIYGTQFQQVGTDMSVWPIRDPEHVDERRASVGLGTLAENETRLGERYRADA